MHFSNPRFIKYRIVQFVGILLILFLTFGILLSQTETLDDPKTDKKSSKSTTEKAKKKETEKKKEKKKKKYDPRIAIDFRDKPIGDFLKAMTRVLDRNILVDEAIKGKITIISNRGVPKSKIFSFFKSVLESRGYAVIEEKQLIKIVPIKDAVAKGGKKVRVGRDFIPDEKISLDRIYTQVVPVYFAEAPQISTLLKSISTKTTSVLVYSATNTIVLTGSGPEINTLLKIVKELDKEVLCAEDDPECVEEAKGNVHIYRVLHHKAEKLASVLIKLENPEYGGEISEVKPKGDIKSKGKGKLKGKKPPRKSSPRKGHGKQQRQQKIKAVAHKETNTLIVTATPQEYKEILKIIRALDIQRKQVLVEVLIAEVSADAANSFGIDWSFTPDKRYPGGSIQHSTGIVMDSGIYNPQSNDFTGVNTLLGFSFGFMHEGKERVLALANLNLNKDNFSILSSPQVMTLENEEAEINVGADVPVVTGSRTSGGGTAEATIQTYDYRPIGIKLKFTPAINKNDTVTLEIFQEVKEIAGETGSTLANPKFTKRDVKTFITVNNEKTVVIAGLVSTNRNKIIRKIPILGDIPILGYLFKREAEKVKKTNLLVFITPHIMVDEKQQKKKLNELRKEQIQFYKRNIKE
jgi:general secretion pathway protein D